MTMDWIDEEKHRRDQGLKRPLSQWQHEAVNARHSGTTMQHCFRCGSATGRCEEDAIYGESEEGPYCEDCWNETEH